MRRLLLACCTCLACTRLNPAFDEQLASGSETRGSTSESSTSESGASESDTSESGMATSDLPSETCEHGPTPGLTLEFGDPSYFGNTCPTGADVWAQISTADAGKATLAVCGQGCTGCGGEHPLSAFPLNITDHLPPPGDACVVVQAEGSVGKGADGCLWGALSIYDPLTQAPYVIATSHSATPTLYGTGLLGEVIPAPVFGSNCNCDDIALSNNCCYQGEPPEFWYFPFAGMQMYAGSVAPIAIPNQANLEYYFKVAQAERIPTCEGDELQLSWAVVAQL